MQHKVPQFIDIEDKIFGPFTIRQFAYLAGGAGLSVIIWRTIPLSIGIFIIAPVVALTIALMFLKPNGKPFVFTIQNFLTYLFGIKIYKWSSPNQTQKMGQSIKNIETEQKFDSKTQSKIISREQIEQIAKKLNSRN